MVHHFAVFLVHGAKWTIEGFPDVDNLDSRFRYSNDWQIITKNLNSTGGNLDIDGGHHLLMTPGSSANITFTCAY